MTAQRLGTLVLGLLCSAAATAAEFRFDASSSQLEFTGDYGGEAVPGIFKKFSGKASFDPTAPLSTRFETEIDVSSLDTDYPERDETLLSTDFFDAGQHPTARWVSSGDCTLADGALQCPGNLTLRGAAHPVPLTIKASADGRELSGTATLDRSQFGVGSGDWLDPETIAHRVAIRFTLKPAG